MYPPPSNSSTASSSSSSSQPHSSQTGLTRYGSAPGSLLTSTVDALIGRGGSQHLLPPGHYFSGGDSTTCKDHHRSSPSSYDAFDGSALLRQKSSPAGFLTHLANTSSHNHNHNHNHNGAAGGFTITRGGGGSRLKSELSFTGGGGGGQECLSRISEDDVVVVADPTTTTTTTTSAAHTQSYAGGGGGWGDNSSNSIVFSAPPTKRSRSNDPDFLHCLNALDSQFSLPQTTLEMAAVEKLLHIPEDSVPCKIRAKRGCATHPRSIAERERRTRISGKLKKLQDLVPNMDKQTSYADMLDLAVQHIKGLQGQVQKLHNELENCTCGCKEST